MEKFVPFTINPFNILTLNTNPDQIQTTNRNLLLSAFINQNQLYKNTIYLCLATDTLDYINRENLSIPLFIHLYYPYLYKQEITSIPELTSKQLQLISKSKELIDSNFIRTEDNVSLFKKIFNDRKSELNFLTKGLTSLNITIKPAIEYMIPLETIFKMLHATKRVPFIKFNPSKKMENIYRLFTSNISTKGTKIPFLNKSLIFKLMKTIGRSKSVTCYIQDNYEGKYFCP